MKKVKQKKTKKKKLTRKQAIRIVETIQEVMLNQINS